MASSSKDKAPTFETALDRLEEIVGEMESAQLPLDELLTKFEEGNKLATFCQEQLQAAEKRIEIVTRKSPPPSETPTTPATTPNPLQSDVSLF